MAACNPGYAICAKMITTILHFNKRSSFSTFPGIAGESQPVQHTQFCIDSDTSECFTELAKT